MSEYSIDGFDYGKHNLLENKTFLTMLGGRVADIGLIEIGFPASKTKNDTAYETCVFHMPQTMMVAQFSNREYETYHVLIVFEQQIRNYIFRNHRTGGFGHIVLRSIELTKSSEECVFYTRLCLERV